MKALSKPLSSPSRADKFPPPLMRFLRSSVGSRSRGRSRSSPIFYLRSKKSNPRVIESAQEPSSPKVTCIGQVRVRRAGKSKVGGAAVKRRRCRWLRKTLLCGGISERLKKPFGRAFCEFFRFGYCKKIDATEELVRVYSNRGGERMGNGVDCDEFRRGRENFGDGSRETASSSDSSVPNSIPKNALILTRCRSAPYRSSSLGGIFWNSSFSEKEEDEQSAENGGKTEQLQIPISVTDEDEQGKRRISEEISTKKMENSISVEQSAENGGKTEQLQIPISVTDEDEQGKRRISEEINTKKMENSISVHPLLLTRCKSEPARIGERLNSEAIFSRLDDVLQSRS